MTRRSPRAAGSSQERPRLAGKEPGSYRATTMFVHFRETPYGLAMSLVLTRRENGKVRHEHVWGIIGLVVFAALPRRRAWPRIFERRSLPCDPLVGGHSAIEGL